MTMKPISPAAPPFDSGVVRAVAGVLRPDAVVAADPLEGVDPEAFAYLARYWHVAATVWLRVRDCPGVPASVRAPLRAFYWQNVEVNAARRSATTELIAVLNAQGIEPMLLKGGCQLFDPPGGHAGTRFMVDLDLLVPPGQDRRSFELLCQRGFAPFEDWDTSGHHHWPKLKRPGDGLVVEIHKAPWFGGGTAETEAFFASSTPIANIAGSASLPSTGHRLLHNAIHAFEGLFLWIALWDAHDLDKAIGCANLRQLLDFVEICFYRGREADWGWILAEADRVGHRADLEQWAGLARELFAARVPDTVANWHVDRPQGRTFDARFRRASKAALRRTGLLGPVRRLKRRWLSQDPG
jgi:Uncharacterised nucleotidyltransferase